MAEQIVSKKTVLFLLVATILISIFSTSLILKKFTYSQQTETPSMSKAEGNVKLTILEEQKPAEPKAPAKATGEVRLTII